MEWDTDLNRAVDEKGIRKQFWTTIFVFIPFTLPIAVFPSMIPSSTRDDNIPFVAV